MAVFCHSSLQRNAIRICLLLIVVFSTGCNIFSPSHSPGDSDDINDLLSDANSALVEENYQQALDVLDRAMSIDPSHVRVRYLHAVATIKVSGIDLLDIIRIFQPAENGGGTQNERILFLTGSELGNLFDAFIVVREDLEPLFNRIISEGRELGSLPETDDVIMSFAISQSLLGMLRILDNDDTPDDFTLDDSIVIEKGNSGWEILIDDNLLDPDVRDNTIDAAIEHGWESLVAGRDAFFRYYMLVVETDIWTSEVRTPPFGLPLVVSSETAVGEMVGFVDEGVQTLYQEKEDL